jgi:hypothetical protein
VLVKSRRQFICQSGLLGAALGLRGAAFAAPRATGVDPRDFGAAFDGRSDDTAAWQAAIDHASARGLPVRPRRPGSSVLVCRRTPRGTYGNNPGTLVYQAVDINRSDLSVDLGGTRLRLIGRGSANAVNYAFGTAKNLRAGSLRNFRFGNGEIDFDPTGDSSINKRALYLVGVDDIEISDLLLTSSGRRAGATITLQNCRRVHVRNLRGINVTQGMNLSYVEDVSFDTLQFDNFSEAIDCDRRVIRLIARNLTFANGGPNNQCLDLNSVEDVLISGVTATNVGNIALVNYKTTTPRTYSEYVGNAPVTRFSPSKNVTIERVRGDRICWPKSTSIPFFLGNDQRSPREGLYPLENIALRDVRLTNCPSYIPVELVRNAGIEDLYFSGARNPSPAMGCIDIRGDQFGTSATLHNVRLVMAPGSTCGVRSNSPSYLKLSSVSVTGHSSPTTVFFDFTALDGNGARVTLEGTSASASSGAGAIAYRFGDSGRATKNYSISLGQDVRELGKFGKRLVLNGLTGRHMIQVPTRKHSR